MASHRRDLPAREDRRGDGASGTLQPKPVKRALAALEVFAHFCNASGLERGDIDAVATSAIRSAGNRDEFLERAEQHSGLPIRVLTREQEARYGYIAAVNSSTLESGCVMDLGGGSLQLVRVGARRLEDWGSWQLGAVTMSERFLPGKGPAKEGSWRSCASSLPPSWSRRHGSRARPASGVSSGSVGRCGTSPMPRSARPACRASACRGSCSRAPPWRS